MMNNKLPILTLIALSLLVFSCKKTPFACFNAPELVEVNEQIQFENCSNNADHYYWQFNDSTTSTEANPLKSYSKRGKYKVYVTAFTKNEGNFTRANKIIEVANRFLDQVTINQISFTRPDGSPWKADSSNPDIRLAYGTVDTSGPQYTTLEQQDVEPIDLPLTFIVPNDQMLLDQDWHFTLLQVNTLDNDTMVQWIINPTQFAKDQPIKLESSVNGTWQANLFFTIR
jgi:PKD repeat protein